MQNTQKAGASLHRALENTLRAYGFYIVACRTSSELSPTLRQGSGYIQDQEAFHRGFVLGLQRVIWIRRWLPPVAALAGFSSTIESFSARPSVCCFGSR